MNRLSFFRCLAIASSLGWALFAQVGYSLADDSIDFNRDIRPILSNHCYACHGPDEAQRATGMRLDGAEGVEGELDSDGQAVVPGSLEKSLIFQRLITSDVDARMPPADFDKQLTKHQIDLIGRWIKQGGEFKPHWAFIPPKQPATPNVSSKQNLTAIDAFIVAKLKSEGLNLAERADKETLIRRVTFDLTGLPPTLEEIDAFLKDNSPNAYEKVVERLLASHEYGEHQARHWLDAARYGDTHGLHLDNERSLWPYRDWVINAFNNNQPFDQFTIEQMAGDLLPEPTLDQRIATGFNRCNVSTSEGGSIKEEVRVRYAVDRVETMGTVFMGLTLGCAVCHEHKYDPITQTEFYQLYAYFNNVDENPMDGNALLPPPIVKIPSDEQQQQIAEIKQQEQQLAQKIKDTLAAIEYVEPETETTAPTGRHEYVWIDDQLPAGAETRSEGGTPSKLEFTAANNQPVFSGNGSLAHTTPGQGQHYFTKAKAGLRIGAGDRFFVHVYIDPNNIPEELMLQFYSENWNHRAIWGADKVAFGQLNTPSKRRLGDVPKAGEWVRLEVEAEQVGLKSGSIVDGLAFTQFGGTVYWDKIGLVTETPQDGKPATSLKTWIAEQRAVEKSKLPQHVQDAIKLEDDKRTPEQTQSIQNHFVEFVYGPTRETFDPLHKQQDEFKNKLAALEKTIPASMVMKDLATPRESFMLIRGEYDKPGDKVTPNVPAALPQLPSEAAPNRLSLARWLVDSNHPLTARVTMNRLWQQYFGVGIVKTTEDFGSQGEWPSHPELLDWLATEFVSSGWNVKHMHKLLVMSAAYQQSSRVSPELYTRDPENRLLARGPRFRLDAETIRDNALSISGLLVKSVGGKSVKPYQPLGLWKAVGYTSSNTANFVQDHGDKLYRRSMYTFWKRTSPPPTLLTFDAPSRESCTVRRARTNTPLQALVLMNETQFVEASRVFGERMMTHDEPKIEDRMRYGFRLATARWPTADELRVIKKVFDVQLAQFKEAPEEAEKLLKIGEHPADGELDKTELAAWTMIGNLILNLSETITKG